MEKGIFVRLWKYIRPWRRYMILALLCSIAGVSLTLFTPILIGWGVDCIVGPGDVDFGKLGSILIILAAVIGTSAFFTWLTNLFTNKLSYKTVQDLRTAVFHQLHEIPLQYIDQSSRGDLMSRVINDIDLIADGLLQGFAQLFTGVVTIVGTLCFMLSIQPLIALVVVAITPLSLFVASFIARHSHQMFQKQASLRGEIGGYTEEILDSQKVVQAFNYGPQAQKKFEDINQQLYVCGVKAQFYSALVNPSTRFINSLVYAGTGIAGAIAALHGMLTIGQISSFLSYANQYTKPFNEISGVVTQLQNAFASAARVFEILDIPRLSSEEGKEQLRNCDGSVKLSDVSFSYHPSRPLIEHFNLDVQPGQHIAIVGPTGCGKTTFINLLMRFYETGSGEIYISGRNIKDITRNSLRACYGMILQDSFLFSGTVRQNIAYGKEDCSDEEVIQAAKMAHAHSFIKRLPRGYNTFITPASLSQGQQQLLCIARIMLTRPPMLILDEATSNIDTRTELKIQNAFDTMMQGRTSFIVAHRLSTIQKADRILVMNQGKIIEQGRHEELLEKGGFYAKLYNSQFEGQQV